MLTNLLYLFNKLFLVKIIKEKNGALHFLRYRLFACPWFRIYVHKICLPDYDAHKHSHPWSFLSIILWGSYVEEHSSLKSNYKLDMIETRLPGNFIYHDRDDVHQIIYLNRPVWTLVFTFGRHERWGYLVTDTTGTYIMDHEKYRKLKNSNQLDLLP